jgi:hypothetical protein
MSPQAIKEICKLKRQGVKCRGIARIKQVSVEMVIAALIEGNYAKTKLRVNQIRGNLKRGRE